MNRKEFRDLASPEAALSAIESLPIAAGTEAVRLADARGRVLAERIDAGRDVPGFDRASMDGFALRARDTFGADEADPAELAVVGTVHAGEKPTVGVGAGEAAEISTGAVMPDGADAVVPVERTDPAGGVETDGRNVFIRTSVAPGDSVMFAGADVAAGERAVGPRTRLTPREIGLLSALGVDEVRVRARPRVGIVSTGDELVRPGDSLAERRGEIYDVNSYTVAAGVEAAGCEPVFYPHAGDDRAVMEEVLHQAASECDLVLSSGSTSASAVDVIYRVIEERGELLLHGVSVKPGKPMLVGRLDGEESEGGDRKRSESAGTGDTHSGDEKPIESGGSAYVGLPGYPVSAMMVFRTFVAPTLRAAAGLPEPASATVNGTFAREERFGEGRRRLMPVGLVEDGSGRTLVYPVDKGSGATTSLAEADGVLTVDADTDYVARGERVAVDLFSPDVRPPSLLAVGEDDPTIGRLLDGLDSPRYLAVGSRPARRRFREGVPDAAVLAGPPSEPITVSGDGVLAGAREAPGGPGDGVSSDESDGTGDGRSGDVEATVLARFEREWGLLVEAGNPRNVGGLDDLVDEDVRFVNRTTDSGLRTTLGEALADLADQRSVDRHDLVTAIDGFDLGLRAHESPPRAVLAGDAEAALGVAESADRLGLGFVRVASQPVTVLVHPDRREKPGVVAFENALESAGLTDRG